MSNQRGAAHFFILFLGGFIVLLIVLFAMNFSFSKMPDLKVGYSKSASESLKNKIGIFTAGIASAGIQEAKCYKVHPECVDYLSKKEVYKTGDQMTENQEFCMFNWCESWEPVPMSIEVNSIEATSYMRDLFGPKAPFSNPTIVFENGLIKARADVDDLYTGKFYVEGVISKKDDFSIHFEAKRAQADSIGLKGQLLSIAESRINEFFNEQLGNVTGLRIDRLEVRGDKLYFEGNFPLIDFPKGEGSEKEMEIMI